MSERDRIAAVLLDADQAERGGGWTWDTASPAKRDQYRRLADRLLAAGVTMPAPKKCPGRAEFSYGNIGCPHPADHDGECF